MERCTDELAIGWVVLAIENDARRNLYRFSTGIEYDYSENVTLGLTYTFLWFGNMKVDHSDLRERQPDD